MFNKFMSKLIFPQNPNSTRLLWLIISLILVTLPHIPRLSFWIPPLFFGLLFWRYRIAQKQQNLPHSIVRFIIAFFIFGGVFLSYGKIFGRDPGSALLVALIGLKLMEMNDQRDALVVCFLSYFLIITNFLYSQSIPTALYMGFVMLVTTGTLISFSDTNNNLSTRQRLRLSTVLLLQAFPVMLVLFILFPRVAGPFWHLPRDSHSGITGLSDTLSLGGISELSQSDAIAFRVKFEGEIPPPSQRYWRGPVLWWTDGQRWKNLYSTQFINEFQFQPLGKPVDYTVILEPHNERWLFALDLPVTIPDNSFLSQEYQILAKKFVRERIRYKLRSHTEYRFSNHTYEQHGFALRLPVKKHEQAHQLAEEWRKNYPSHAQDAQIVEQALRYFNQQNFRYTLNPIPVVNDTVDEFLFETREGFCGHYASAFVVLMRAAKIPARMVTGYLGGEINPLGNYLIVRQRHAHAWAEVWLKDRGWVRVDPTGAVSPERVEDSIETALPSDFEGLGVNWQGNSAIAQFLQQMRNSWDLINTTWNEWVLSYGPEQQKLFLSQLGLKNFTWRGMTTILVLIISSLFITIAIYMVLQTRKQSDPAQQLYARFCKKLARRGMHRRPSEGPLTFARRASTIHPDLAQKIHKITQFYIELRYRSQLQFLPKLKSAIRRFHP